MNGKDSLALWAGMVAFFGSLLAVGIFDVFEPDQWVEYIGALLVAFVTGGSVYAKQRYDDVKKAREANLTPPTTYEAPKKDD